ncbi:MAG: hypothetical protein ACE5G5_04045, partial [Candidatus Methylomirabilales bacterium]
MSSHAHEQRSPLISEAAFKLFLCGASALFWELVLIRWLGSTVRVVAYYSNFVLISAFFGLGAGALLDRTRFHLWKKIFVLLALCVFMGPVLGSFFHLNPTSSSEFVWIGAPQGILPLTFSGDFLGLNGHLSLPYWAILGYVYTMNALLFVAFGQWLAHLFQKFPPLEAYTIEVGGSILGIFLFTFASLFDLTPMTWFLIGFALVLPIIDRNIRDYLVALACSALVLLACGSFARQFAWSPYYKIYITPLKQIHDFKRDRVVQFDRPIGYALMVNNDYHQMALDLRPRSEEHAFFSSWRWLYDYPYQQKQGEPEGPILIVGAGAGNDVSAALRNTQSTIDAVEIDPMIIRLGRHYHFERPYFNPRVRITVDDARSFFARTDKRYAKIVFGFLDSHTLMSSFSSVRLDNFVYTYETMRRVKELLLPGGKVYVTFASNTVWLHKRIIQLLDAVFDYRTTVAFDREGGYANGIVYTNAKAPIWDNSPLRKGSSHKLDIKIPTDDWPFLYMKEPGIPTHYKVFIVIVVLMGAGSLLLLPPRQRGIRLPYFFMGAGFFLIETSNVVSLSLLYGSTWVVNVTVFTGILGLILLGNVTCILTSRPRYGLTFSLLFANIIVSYATRPSSL